MGACSRTQVNIKMLILLWAILLALGMPMGAPGRVVVICPPCTLTHSLSSHHSFLING
jgi:hypothetical protein